MTTLITVAKKTTGTMDAEERSKWPDSFATFRDISKNIAAHRNFTLSVKISLFLLSEQILFLVRVALISLILNF